MPRASTTASAHEAAWMSAYEELELGIGGLDSDVAEETVASLLRNLRGIHGVRLVRGGGAHIIFNPLGITREEICATLRRAGFALDTNQKTGEL